MNDLKEKERKAIEVLQGQITFDGFDILDV